MQKMVDQIKLIFSCKPFPYAQKGWALHPGEMDEHLFFVKGFCALEFVWLMAEGEKSPS